MWLFVFVAALFVIALGACLIGVPLTLLLARYELEQPWSYPLAGAFAGAALMQLFAGGPFIAAGALPGALSGAIWWLAYRRHEQPDPPEALA